MRRLDGIPNSMDMGLGGLQELVMDWRPDVLQFMGSQEVRHNWAIELKWNDKWYPMILKQFLKEELH